MKIYHFLFLSLFFFACQNESAKYAPQAAEAESLADQAEDAVAPEPFGMNEKEQVPQSPPPTPVENKVNTTPRRVIKNADYRIQVEDVDATTASVISLAESHGGYLANMELVNTNHEMTNKMTLKVPAERFEVFLNAVGKEAIHVAHRRVNSKDVTAEYVDLQARLKTKKDVKERYEEILRSKTKTISEVLDTEEKIRRLQEEIEAAEGRLRYLSNLTGMSTINLEVYQPKEYEHEPVAYSESFWLKLWEGFENGWASVTSVILFFVNLWPMVFVLAFVFWRRKKIFGHFYHKKAKA